MCSSQIGTRSGPENEEARRRDALGQLLALRHAEHGLNPRVLREREDRLAAQLCGRVYEVQQLNSVNRILRFQNAPTARPSRIFNDPLITLIHACHCMAY